MRSSQLPTEWPRRRGQRMQRILRDPLTLIVLVWALMLGLVGLCFAVVE